MTKMSTVFLRELYRPSKMMNVCKKSRSKFPLFRQLLRFNFSIVLYCYSIVSFHFRIINEGIVYFRNGYNFWIPRAKNMRKVKFYRSNSIISKITRPSFLQFSIVKGTTYECESKASMTSLLLKMENSNLDNSRNCGNFDLLFFANIHHF